MDKIVAWGWNAYGQLGDGTTQNPPGPVLVTGLPDYETESVKQLAAGQLHSLALLSNGEVWAWGANDCGQLGNNSTRPSPIPVQVVGLGGEVEEIAAGSWHNLARRKDGVLLAWGYNFSGQLGIGKLGHQQVPVEVKALQGVKAIAAGMYHSLAAAVAVESGVWAWGHNYRGMLGPGTTANVCPLPVPVITLPKGTVPEYVGVAAGNSHSLARRSDGVVMAWGRNRSGELGDGTTDDRALLGEVAELPRGQDAITEIAASGGHSLALAPALYDDKTAGVWAWGHNKWGQLGNGKTTQSQPPVPGRVVDQGGKGYLANVTAIAAGRSSSLALGGNGTVWAWGSKRTKPVQVIITPLGPSTVAVMNKIAAGTGHFLAAGQISS